MGMIDFTTSVGMDSTSVSNARKTGSNKGVFDLDDFYTLFAKQLQNQDMMNPVDDSQFLAQMAQMATVQAMEQMNEMTMTSYAFEFLGKEVIIAEYDVKNELKTVEGVVEKVTLYNGEPQVFVGGKAYELAQVMEVLGASKSDEEIPPEKDPDDEKKDEETQTQPLSNNQHTDGADKGDGTKGNAVNGTSGTDNTGQSNGTPDPNAGNDSTGEGGSSGDNSAPESDDQDIA